MDLGKFWASLKARKRNWRASGDFYATSKIAASKAYS
jgi:hypothetical protein